jgi:TATA-binding protein-associated factor
MTVTSLPREWIVTPFLRLLFQNLVVEERADIRAVTLTAWRTALEVVADVPGWMKKLVKQQTVLDWYSTMMTPLGAPIDCSTFHYPAFTEDDSDAGPLERHNVDKNMLAQDLSLVSAEVIMQARIAAATSMAYLMIYWPPKVLHFLACVGLLLIIHLQSIDELFQPILVHYLQSTSMLQKFLAALVSEEWARAYDTTSPTALIIETFPLAAELSTMCLAWLQGTPPIAYHEMAFTLHRIHSECAALLRCFATDCKIPISLIPHLGDEIDITGTKPNSFTIETAEEAVGPMYMKLKDGLGRTKKRELGVIAEKRQKVVVSIEQYSEVKAQHDTRVSAAFAAAFVAFRSTPDKVSPVVKGIMNGIKVC